MHTASLEKRSIACEEGHSYLMIKSFTIENFRCFKKTELHDLGIINLLVGPNGSGKTSFMEALYLLLGVGPGLALRIRSWRGLPKIELQADRDDFEGLFLDLFFHFDSKQRILISEVDSYRSSRTLTIAFREQESFNLPLGEDNAEFENARPVPLEFEYRIDGQPPKQAIVQIKNQELVVGGITDSVRGVFFGGIGHHGQNTVKRFSDMIKGNKETEIIDLVKQDFPMIEDMIVAEHFGQSVLFAKIKGVPERKIPIELVSMGIHKYLGIILAMKAIPKGILIVDEIDNGLHHSQLINIWKKILKIARDERVQIFASTHSAECISALAEAVKDTPNDLRVLHMKSKDGQSNVTKFAGEDALSAIWQGFEVR